MEKNIVARVYNNVQNIADVIEQEGQQKELPSSGLLSPKNRMGKPKNETLEESPLYRVATYFNQIRKKREELKNGRGN